MGRLLLAGALLLTSLAPDKTTDSSEAWQRAQALFSAGKPDEAVPILESLVSSRPGSAVALRGLAAAYAAVGDERAEETYRRAIALAPRDFPLRFESVESLWAAGRADAADEEMARLLSEAGGARLRKRYAFELMRQQRFADASREFAQSCRDARCDAQALEAWGSALLEMGRFEDAAARYRDAIARAPDRVSARHNLGRVLLLAGNPAAARIELERAVQHEPDSPDVWLDLGRALEALGQVDPAEAAYRRSLSFAPDLPRAHYALGALLARRGHHEEEARREIALYQRAFEREQKDRFQAGARRAELTLGWTDLAGGEVEKAAAQFGRHPDDPEALRGRASALARLGRHAEAVAALEHALSISPADPKIRHALARERENTRTP